MSCHWSSVRACRLLVPCGVPCVLAGSEAEEAKARLADAATKLEVSEAGARELEEKLALLLRKSESALGEERLKVTLN